MRTNSESLEETYETNWAVLAARTFAFALVSNVNAATILTATITGDQAGSGSPGTGMATVTLSDDMTQLMVDVSFSGLVSNTTVAHIHCCAAPGASAGIAIPFAGFPPGVTSGTYTNTFMLPADLMIPMDVFTAGLLGGNAYVNIHTTEFPGGEIRGQLAAVPEPGTIAITLLGLAALGVRRSLASAVSRGNRWLAAARLIRAAHTRSTRPHVAASPPRAFAYGSVLHGDGRVTAARRCIPNRTSTTS